MMPPLSQEEFAAEIAAAVTAGCPYAAGKLGFSEQHWLRYPMVLAAGLDRRRIRAYETVLWHHFTRQSGVYPANPEFAREFVERYARELRNLDCVGLFGAPGEEELLRFHGLGCRRIGALDMEPDRSVPANDERCWLQALRGCRVLLVASFAELLRQRATCATFESVWRRIGKRWFYPSCVEAVEFPYAFEQETQQRFPTVFELHDFICERIDAVEFDVALIAAGGLAVPIAAHVKRRGRVGISLGGHLQVLFGVLGRRWRDQESWKRDYFNEAWIDMPERYRPLGWENLSDGGAYW